MKRHLRAAEGVFIIVILITFLIYPLLHAAAESLPKPEEIIAKNIEAMGGKKAHDKIKSKKIVINFKIVPMNMDAKATCYQERPDKYYVFKDVGTMGKERIGSDGKIAWAVSPFIGTRLFEGEELANMLIKSRFDGPDGPNALYKSMKTEGIEQVNGKTCYKVVKTPEKGSSRTIYYDKESFLIVKFITDYISPQGTFKEERYYEKYQKINNILFPYKTTIFLNDQKQNETIYEKIELNIKMPEGLFDIPEEIKAIMKEK